MRGDCLQKSVGAQIEDRDQGQEGVHRRQGGHPLHHFQGVDGTGLDGPTHDMQQSREKTQ